MTTNSLAMLDQAELLQLAMDASRNNDSGTSISYLKEAVSRPDTTATAHFILGAEYAQIKMYDCAATELEAAIALDPSLAIARFQLGLLWLSSGVPDRALKTLEPLEELGEQNALTYFGRGLIHLMRDEFVETVQCLVKGIELNTENPALNMDMQKIIDEVNRLPPDSLQSRKSPTSTEDIGGRHIFISAYTGNGKSL
jgi:tetratricopeptide (TPR) repeat protein